MIALAAFVMRNRWTAALVAALSAVLFWLFPPFLVVSGAVVALVSLRQGAAAGVALIGLAGAAAGVLAVLVLGSPWSMLEVLLACWLPVLLLALVLRATVSLSSAVQAAALLGLLGVMGFYLVLGDPAAWWGGILDQWEQRLVAQAAAQPASQETLEQLLVLLRAWAPYLPGQVTGAVLLITLASLLLGRWQQAALFNPGGFRPEFHGLRLGRPLAMLALAVFGAALLSGWPPLLNVALTLGVIYTLQGLALVHAVAHQWRISPAWLLLVYVFLLAPLWSQLVMALGVVDAWADFRQRFQSRPGRQ